MDSMQQDLSVRPTAIPEDKLVLYVKKGGINYLFIVQISTSTNTHASKPDIHSKFG